MRGDRKNRKTRATDPTTTWQRLFGADAKNVQNTPVRSRQTRTPDGHTSFFTGNSGLPAETTLGIRDTSKIVRSHRNHHTLPHDTICLRTAGGNCDKHGRRHDEDMNSSTTAMTPQRCPEPHLPSTDPLRLLRRLSSCASCTKQTANWSPVEKPVVLRESVNFMLASFWCQKSTAHQTGRRPFQSSSWKCFRLAPQVSDDLQFFDHDSFVAGRQLGAQERALVGLVAPRTGTRSAATSSYTDRTHPRPISRTPLAIENDNVSIITYCKTTVRNVPEALEQATKALASDIIRSGLRLSDRYATYCNHSISTAEGGLAFLDGQLDLCRMKNRTCLTEGFFCGPGHDGSCDVRTDFRELEICCQLGNWSDLVSDGDPHLSGLQDLAMASSVSPDRESKVFGKVLRLVATPVFWWDAHIGWS